MFDVEAHLDLMRREAERVASNRTESRDGIVTNYDPNRYMARVRIMPEDFMTGWLPIGTLSVGNGSGIYCGLLIGEIVTVLFSDGDINAGRIAFSLNSTSAKMPPVPCQPGQILMVDPKGSFLKLTNDGKVGINGQAEVDIGGPKVVITTTGDTDVNAGGNVNVGAQAGQIALTSPTILLDGNVEISGSLSGGTGPNGGTATFKGDISTTGNVSDSVRSMAADRVIYDGHDHNDPQGGTSSAPNQQQ